MLAIEPRTTAQAIFTFMIYPRNKTVTAVLFRILVNTSITRAYFAKTQLQEGKNICVV